MKPAIKTLTVLALALATLFTACEKGDYIPEKPSTPNGPSLPGTPLPQPAADSVVLFLKMSIRVGEVIYDSIPFAAEITSVSGGGPANVKRLDLPAGTNRVVLYGTHDRYQVKVRQWGITDEIALTKQQLATMGTMVLGGSKAAKRLQMEESYVFTEAAGYLPQGKTEYRYDGSGRLIRAIFYQKYPQHADLKLTLVDKFIYAGGKLDRIERFDASRDTTTVPASFTAFTYNGQGRIASMYNNQTNETAARVSYGIENRYATTTINYYYDNNTSLTYTMKFRGGNKVSDEGRSSLGHFESGSYTYDFNINPYVHMSWPDLYLSHESKNNVVAQQKSYSGAYPSGDPYKFQYQYDGEGYPTEKITTYKSVFTGADLYRTKTVYTY